MKRRMLTITAMCFVMMTMVPAISAYAYGGNFNFHLIYKSDDDNAQCPAYRDGIFVSDDAYVTVTSANNASNNMKMKVLKKSADGYILGQATNERYYTSAYLNKNLILSYVGYPYRNSTGMFSLYGHCTTGDCDAAGNWRP